MDINYELYKVFFSRCLFPQLFRGEQTIIHLPVCGQPVHQDLRKKLGQPLFIRSTKKCSSHLPEKSF